MTVLSNGGADVYNKMLELYDKADMQEEKVRICRSLGVSDKPGLIQQTLDFAMSVST